MFFPGLLGQQDIGGGEPPVAVAPTVVSVTSAEVLSGTSHSFTLPTTASGELLVILASADGGTTDAPNTAASGWSQIYTGGNGNVGVSYLVKAADGTESGATLNITTATTEHVAALIFRIQDWSGNLANIAVGAELNGANLLTPPSLTSGFGSVPTLWICSLAYSANVTLNSAPTDYTANSAGTSSTNNSQIFSGHRQLTAASESPGAFSSTAPAANASLNTMAVRGTG